MPNFTGPHYYKTWVISQTDGPKFQDLINDFLEGLNPNLFVDIKYTSTMNNMEIVYSAMVVYIEPRKDEEAS